MLNLMKQKLANYWNEHHEELFKTVAAANMAVCPRNSLDLYLRSLNKMSK